MLRRLRAQQGLTIRGQTPMSKPYIYLKVPHLHLGGMVSQDGYLISDNPEKQAIIEQHHPSVWQGDLWLAVGALAHQAQGLTVKPVKPDAVCIVMVIYNI